MPRGREVADVRRRVPDNLPPPLRSDPNPGLLRAALHGLYDVLWLLAAAVGSPWLLWRCLRDRGFAQMLRERTGWAPPPAKQGRRGTVLVHGVSVGEVKGAVPLVEAVEERFPDREVVISTTTNTGIQVARQLFPELRVVRFPADITPAVRLFLDRVDPDFVVLIELEVWPNFLRACNRRGIPVSVVNGRITDRSHGRYALFRNLLPQFNRLSLVCVQDEEYAARFRSLSFQPERVFVTGSIKADRLRLGPVDPGAELRRLLGPREGQLVLVAGSTHQPEEELVIRAWQRGAPGTRLVLVPRHPERAAELVRTLGALGVRVQRLTELRAGSGRPDPARPCLVDTIGELERVYGLADVVFVGGSLIPHGGQNMLEPAAQGKAVLFGPHVDNFSHEAALLLAQGACLRVDDAEQLADAFAELAADADLRRRMAGLGEEVVRSQKGATALTIEALLGVGLGNPTG
ncbi:MAG: 3-deoxy-D-manno-octulosonic acid transferase [Planctomycetota bacterium]